MAAETPFAYQQAWYPVSPLQDLDPRRPQPLTLLGEPYVIWKPPLPGSHWQVFLDRCPHRLAPLSEGRLDRVSGQLMCSYHGWQFDAEGLCRRIPQADPAVPEPGQARHLCATRLPCREAADLLWLWPDAASADRAGATPLPISSFLEQALSSPGFVIGSVLRDLPYDWQTLVENVADPSHVPFAHHGIQGRRERAAPIPLVMEQETPEQMVATVESRSIAMRTRITFQPPALLEYVFLLPGGKEMGLITWCVPVAPGRSRIVALFPRNFAQRQHTLVPRWWDHATNRNAVLDGDLLLLRHQERLLAGQSWRQAYRLPTRADRLVIAVRRWMDRHGVPFALDGDGSAQANVIPADPLLSMDRFQQHTTHCRSCRRALAWTEAFQLSGAAVFVLSLPAAVLWPTFQGVWLLLGAWALLAAVLLRWQLRPRFRARLYEHWRR